MLFAIFGASAIYGSPLNWRFPTTKSQAIAGLSSADVLKADLEAITGQSAREEERPAMRDSAALTQLTVRLDQIEHEYGARLDKLSERVDQDSASRFADIAARLDKLEKIAALLATPVSESADVVARLDKLEKKVAVTAAPASEIAGLTTRLNKLEKRAAVAGASSANPLPPAAPKQSSLMARADPPAPNETARSDNAGPLLRDYSVENVRDGIAVVDSRYGPQEVAPGDSIPGAGRVLRIEKRGGDWFVDKPRRQWSYPCPSSAGWPASVCPLSALARCPIMSAARTPQPSFETQSLAQGLLQVDLIYRLPTRNVRFAQSRHRPPA